MYVGTRYQIDCHIILTPKVTIVDCFSLEHCTQFIRSFRKVFVYLYSWFILSMCFIITPNYEPSNLQSNQCSNSENQLGMIDNAVIGFNNLESRGHERE